MSHASEELDRQPIGESAERTDAELKRFGYGRGGVPWYLFALYLSFLVFFVWYVLEYQLPEYLDEGPGRGGEPPMTSTR